MQLNDINIWVNLLSFIQIAVAFNWGCVLIKRNPLNDLFNTYNIKGENNTNLSIEDFRKDYSKRLDSCREADGIGVNHPKFQEISALYLKIDRLFERATIYRNLDTICFPYACLLLGMYGLLGLYSIPHHATERVLHYYILFTILAILVLLCLLVIEIIHRTCKERVIQMPEKKYFTIEIIFLIIAYIVLACISEFIPDAIYDFIIQRCYFIEISAWLSFVSFVVCFVLVFIDNYRMRNIKKNISEDLNNFNKKYVELRYGITIH